MVRFARTLESVPYFILLKHMCLKTILFPRKNNVSTKRRYTPAEPKWPWTTRLWTPSNKLSYVLPICLGSNGSWIPPQTQVHPLCTVSFAPKVAKGEASSMKKSSKIILESICPPTNFGMISCISPLGFLPKVSIYSTYPAVCTKMPWHATSPKYSKWKAELLLSNATPEIVRQLIPQTSSFSPQQNLTWAKCHQTGSFIP